MNVLRWIVWSLVAICVTVILGLKLGIDALLSEEENQIVSSSVATPPRCAPAVAQDQQGRTLQLQACQLSEGQLLVAYFNGKVVGITYGHPATGVTNLFRDHKFWNAKPTEKKTKAVLHF